MAAHERNLTVEFRERAGTRHHKCPATADFSGWLFLMQHYRLPTRLLDWTESVLAATFFAVEDGRNQEKPGALWGLNPSAMNKEQIGVPGLLVSDDGRVVDLFEAAFVDPEVAGAQTLVAAAVGVREIDIRMLVQQSMFTIHANEESLENLPHAPDYLEPIS